MSALEEVLAGHAETGDWPNVCSCGFSALSGDHVPSVLRAHVAAAVNAWITERLQGEDVREAVARAICAADPVSTPDSWEHLSYWRSGVYRRDATAALTAVTDALREGAS